MLSAFNPFSYCQKEYKRVSERNLPNLKLTSEEEVKVVLKLWVQLFIVKVAVYYSQKKYNFFVRPRKLFV